MRTVLFRKKNSLSGILEEGRTEQILVNHFVYRRPKMPVPYQIPLRPRFMS